MPGPTRSARHPLGQPAAELLGDAALDVEPVGGGAGLAAVAHLGDHRAVERGVEVGVGEHEERRVAAELHRAVDDLVGRLASAAPGPTSVEPVNDSLRTRGSCSIAETTAPDRRAGSTLTTPAGHAGLVEDLRPSPARSAGCRWPA